jgi:hypothetical protein
VRLLRIVPTHPIDAVAAIDPDDIDDLRDLRGLLRYPDWRELMTALPKYIETPARHRPTGSHGWRRRSVPRPRRFT